MAAIAQEVSFEPTNLLCSENDAADSMFVLMEGQVALVRNGRESKRLGPGHVVGLLPVLAGDSHPESAQATQPTRALRIDQQDFYDVMAEDFDITRGILRVLVGLAAEGSS